MNAPDTARAMAGRIRRTAHAVVGDLRLLLQKLSLPTPYVLVGHSLGAVHMMLLAAESPELAGAMLLLDPPPHGFISGERFPGLLRMAAQQTAELQRMAKEATEQNAPGRAVFLETVASEHEAAFGNTATQVARVQTLGQLPLTVIASEIPNPAFGPDAEAFQQFWIESNRQVAASGGGLKRLPSLRTERRRNIASPTARITAPSGNSTP